MGYYSSNLIGIVRIVHFCAEILAEIRYDTLGLYVLAPCGLVTSLAWYVYRIIDIVARDSNLKISYHPHSKYICPRINERIWHVKCENTFDEKHPLDSMSDINGASLLNYLCIIYFSIYSKIIIDKCLYIMYAKAEVVELV